MTPISGEVPQIDWPTIVVGDQRLVVRWTFYAQWLLSKRKVNVKDLPTLMQAKDPALVDIMVECFTATVAENFTARALPAPNADHWALAISQANDPGLWGRVNQAIWQAVGKAPPAVATPAPQATATGAALQ
jgi:hypothetical protein